ncbi:MAG: hypothetical protein WBW73_13940 [Rhodoplanes sp.]
MQNPNTTELSDAERLARVCDRVLDLSVPLVRLEDLIARTERIADLLEQAADRAQAVARELKGHIFSAQHHMSDLFALVDDGRLADKPEAAL